MNPPVPPASFLSALRRRPVLVAAVLLGFVTWLAYRNSFNGSFHFDDSDSILANPTIRRLWPLVGAGSPLAPPGGGITVSGRPLVNLSLAINYAISGEAVWSYHGFNFVVHVLAGLVLFGLVRRTLLQPPCAGHFGASAVPLAGAIAGLWLLHPLQTESVTYIVQRAESLMGLFYLGTLYAFVRATDSPRSRRWLAASVAACLAGMATKEVMASAPLLVLLYDRTFVAGSFAAAWRRRRPYYLALAAAWLLLGALMFMSGNRNATAGLGTVVSTRVYMLTQCHAIPLYLQLSFWPDPLVFDYGSELVERFSDVWPGALLVAALVGATVLALWRRPALGFAGAWFLGILAPTSSFVPVASQTLAEHRLYLPLAAVVTLTVLAVHAWFGRRGLVLAVAAAVALGMATARRNAVYRDEFTLWSDSLAQRPDNPRAQNDLGFALSEQNRHAEALSHYAEAVRLQPDYVDALNNLGHELTVLGRIPDALPPLERAVRLQPAHVNAHINLGNVYFALGRANDALAHFQEAIRLESGNAIAHHHVAHVLLSAGHPVEAIPEYREALRLDPDFALACAGLGYALILAGQPAEAAEMCQRAIRLDPNFAEAHNHLGIARSQQGRPAEAIDAFQVALRLNPDFADAHNNLGNMLLQAGRPSEAVAHYERALQLNPNLADAHHNLGEALTRLGQPAAAASHFEAAQRLRVTVSGAQPATPP